MLARMWGKKGTVIHYWWGCKIVHPVWRLLKKLKIQLPNDSAILLLGIYLKVYKSGYNKITCTPMFIAALFIRAKLWKQSSCPTTMNELRKFCII
jgi:hypothetical protein